MRVNRRFLYAGLFLVAIGAVAVAAEGNLVDATTLAGVVQLWPAAVIAIGAALVLKRTPLSLAGGMFAAAMPGLVLGSAFAVAPRFAGSCGAAADPAITSTQHGTFDGPTPPVISLTTGCGSLEVGTAFGKDWRLEAGNSAGLEPNVYPSAESLEVQMPGKPGWQLLGGGRDRWVLTLPQTDINGLEIHANANQSRIDLTGTRIGGLEIEANASDVTVDGTGSTFGDLTVQVNAGGLWIRMPNRDDVTASLHVNAGSLQVCVPEGVGTSIDSRANAARITVAGLSIGTAGRANGSGRWQSDDYESATYHADLQIRANFGTVEINPIGGCR